MSKDRINGMIVAHALGDALGAPHEFNSKVAYTGKLEHEIVINTRFQGQRVEKVGSITDDTQMAFTLLNTIYLVRRYDSEFVTYTYISWANSGVKSMGRNTRALFKGITTLNGFYKRYERLVMEVDINERTQSNGSLMRAYPLALLDDEEDALLDCHITNSNPINEDCSRLYYRILRKLLHEKSKKNIVEFLKEYKPVDKVIQEAIDDALAKKERKVSGRNNGWVVIALYVALYAYLHFDNYTDAYRWIIELRGDTDTNAAIAGALLGAKFGYQKLLKEQKKNLMVLSKANPKYFLTDTCIHLGTNIIDFDS